MGCAVRLDPNAYQPLLSDDEAKQIDPNYLGYHRAGYYSGWLTWFKAYEAEERRIVEAEVERALRKKIIRDRWVTGGLMLAGVGLAAFFYIGAKMVGVL